MVFQTSLDAQGKYANKWKHKLQKAYDEMKIVKKNTAHLEFIGYIY